MFFWNTLYLGRTNLVPKISRTREPLALFLCNMFLKIHVRLFMLHRRIFLPHKRLLLTLIKGKVAQQRVCGPLRGVCIK